MKTVYLIFWRYGAVACLTKSSLVSVLTEIKKLGSGQSDMTRKGSDWNGDGQICDDDVTIPHL